MPNSELLHQRYRLKRRRGKQEFMPHWQAKGFHVESLRWIVEGTFAWLDNARVLCPDYEMLPENYQGTIRVVMIRLMLRRLCNINRTRKDNKP
jgi:transposase